MSRLAFENTKDINNLLERVKKLEDQVAYLKSPEHQFLVLNSMLSGGDGIVLDKDENNFNVRFNLSEVEEMTNLTTIDSLIKDIRKLEQSYDDVHITDLRCHRSGDIEVSFLVADVDSEEKGTESGVQLLAGLTT